MSCLATALTANTAGQTYTLNSDSLRLIDYRGLGIPNVRRLSQRTPDQDGDTDLDRRIDQRYIDLYWVINGGGRYDLQTYRDLREELQEVFQPRRNDPVQLIFDFGDYQRAADVNLDGSFVFTEQIGSRGRASCMLKATDWRLYDPAQIALIFSLATSTSTTAGWPIPWPIPWPIGSSVLDMTLNIEYANLDRLAAPEYPIFNLYGPLRDVYIENETTGEVIDLSDNGGLYLSDATKTALVDLTPGEKTILDEDGDSADQYLTTDSDLATWHLAPAGELLSDGSYCTGINVVTIRATSITADSYVAMSYYDRYQGV